MNKRNDGGGAFPHKFSVGSDGYGNEHFAYSPGMSLRDWFAGQALVTFATGRGWPSGDDFKELATRAYGIADAMLTARAK